MMVVSPPLAFALPLRTAPSCPSGFTSSLKECPPSTQKDIPQSAKRGNKCAVLGPGVPVVCDRFLTAVETGTAALLWASHAISGV
jgi:hypothetical protein